MVERQRGVVERFREYAPGGESNLGRAAFPPLPANASPGKRWRFRRNAVIFVAHQNGISQRILAEVFDLPRSRIASIVREFRAYL